MARVKIPDGEQESLQHLARMSEEHFSAIVNGLAEVNPTTHMPTFIRRSIQSAALGEDGQLYKTIGSVIAIANALVTNGSDPDSIVNDLSHQLRSESWLEQDEIPIFRDRLLRFFSIDNVILIAQAFGALASSHAYYQRADISSTIAPLYLKSRPDDELGGATVLHELVLRTSSLNDEFMTFRCLLDLDDLQQIRKKVDEALRRDKALKDFIGKTGLQIVSDSSDSQ